MDDSPHRKPKKKFRTVVLEIMVLLCLIVVAGAMGWFVGRADVKDVRAVNRQLQEERARSAELRAERAILRAEIQTLQEGGLEKKETDLDKLLARQEAEWNRKINQIRIEAEVEKVKRVEDLERELRLLKMDQRMKEQMLAGDDSAVPEGLAEGLTPRARQVCSEMLAWEGLEGDAFIVAQEKLARDLGARSLVRVKFGSGSANVGNDDLDAIRIALEDSKDYSLILAVGFADTGGDEELNRELGSQRARNTAESMRSFIRRGQLVESVYLGETSRFGPRAENRTVEVWELQR